MYGERIRIEHWETRKTKWILDNVIYQAGLGFSPSDSICDKLISPITSAGSDSKMRDSMQFSLEEEIACTITKPSWIVLR